jgi:hypothetical protein
MTESVITAKKEHTKTLLNNYLKSKKGGDLHQLYIHFRQWIQEGRSSGLIPTDKIPDTNAYWAALIQDLDQCINQVNDEIIIREKEHDEQNRQQKSKFRRYRRYRRSRSPRSRENANLLIVSGELRAFHLFKFESILLQERATINGDFEKHALDMTSDREMISSIHESLKNYRKDIKHLDSRFQKELKVRPFRWSLNDANHIHNLRKVMGAAGDQEVGWQGYASAVGLDLRHIYLKTAVQERFRNRQPFQFLLALILLITSHPKYLATLFVGIVFIFTNLYTFNAAQNPACTSEPWSLSQIGNHLFEAITNMVSLGSSPCGPWTGTLLSIEGLLGYFILAMLASAIIEAMPD